MPTIFLTEPVTAAVKAERAEDLIERERMISDEHLNAARSDSGLTFEDMTTWVSDFRDAVLQGQFVD